MRYFPQDFEQPIRRLSLTVAVLGLGLALACSSDDGDSDSGSDASDSGAGAAKGSGDGDSSSSSGDGDSSSSSGDGDSSSSSGDGDSSSSSGDGDSSSSSGDGDSSSGSGLGSGVNSACGLANVTSTRKGVDIEDFEECGGISFEAESVAADILIMVDQSVSMGEPIEPDNSESLTRWEALTGGLKEFISSDKAKNLRIGLMYFGLPPTSDKDKEEGRQTSCEVSDYEKLDVDMGRVADNESELLDSLDDHYPSNLTPTIPALAGALNAAKQWAEDNPGRPTVLVLATDGYPTECEDRDIQTLEDLAREFAEPTDGSPRVSTFVVGIGKVSNLKRVAIAGGTQKAFFVGDCPTAVEDLTASLLRVASSPALCEFAVPEPEAGKTFDPDELNMVFTPDDGVGEVVFRRDSMDDCGSGGWYYDNNANPTRVHVCPETCGNFGGGVVDVVVGCKSRTIR